MGIERDYFREFFKYGIAGLVAGILLYVFVMDVRADQKATRAEHAAMTLQDATTATVIKELLETQKRSVYLQLRQCINTARTPSDRDACARYTEGR